MDRQLEDELRVRHPDFFRGMRQPMRQRYGYNAMAHGCSCGDGWFDLIDWAASKYEELAAKHGIEIFAIQVKEKWGRLEVYINSGPGSAWGVCRDETTALDSEIRQRSMHTCELCGDKDEDGAECDTKASRGGYWIRTLCQSCRVVDEADQKDFPKARALLERLKENLAQTEEISAENSE